jgi:diguanylate cyclase (GGDEF)-like protein
MLDLDHFKKINDTHGHLAGDDVLRAVAKAITNEVRRDDATGRWGGEEFAVLLPEVDIDELATIADRIRRRIGSLVVTITANHGPGTVQDLTISIGGARYPSPGLTTLDDLLLAADSALYTAKQAGRDRVHIPAPPTPVDSPPQPHD